MIWNDDISFEGFDKKVDDRLNVARGLYCAQENLDKKVLIDISGVHQICYSHDLSKNEENEYKTCIEMICEMYNKNGRNKNDI